MEEDDEEGDGVILDLIWVRMGVLLLLGSRVLEIYIRHILVQCNRPKPSPTCTSNLGFSRLYILMLWLIVTQVLYYILTK